MNLGFNPLEGKYNKSRCAGCLKFYDPCYAKKLNWKCFECGKSIKKGVDYRIYELSTTKNRKSPEHRPDYKHIIPLSEIVGLAIGIKNTWSTKVQLIWKKFIDNFGNEIRVLLEEDIKNLAKVDSKIAEYVEHFRNNKINYFPGGAGVYGKLLRPGEEVDPISPSNQKSLNDF